MPTSSRQCRSPNADVLERLRRLEHVCRAYAASGLDHFGPLAAVVAVLADAFASMGHEPSLWLVALAASAREEAEARVLARAARAAAEGEGPR